MSLPRLRRSRTPLALALLVIVLSGCATTADPLRAAPAAPAAASRTPTAVVLGPPALPLQPVALTRTFGPPVPKPAPRPVSKTPTAENLPAKKPPATRPRAKKPAATRPAAKSHRRVDCRRLRCVALTFDDGPGPYTAHLVRTLRGAHAPATFFMLGEQVDAYPKVAHRVSAAGFEIGNHSYTHPDLTEMSRAEVRAEVSRTDVAIRHATGRTPTLLRPPYGARDKRVDRVAYRYGLSEVLWDVDTLDWKHRRVTSVQHRALAGVRGGSIVLLHDIHPKTVEAVPCLVTALRKRGYTLVTVSDLIGAPRPGSHHYGAD